MQSQEPQLKINLKATWSYAISYKLYVHGYVASNHVYTVANYVTTVQLQISMDLNFHDLS